MLSYILKVTLCWAACYLLFHLLLRKETFFRLNRWYLLGAAFIGLLIPAVDFQMFMEQASVPDVAYYLQPVTIGVHQLETVIVQASKETESFDWWQLLSIIYLIGAFVSMIRFLYGLKKIHHLFRNGKVLDGRGYRFVSTPANHVPFSFFKHLFWSERFQVDAADRTNILRHEEAHIYQWHSLDVLFMELLSVIFWCSPPVYFFKKAVKTNHEYLADEAVLKNESRSNYGQLLLRQFRPGMQFALSNSLFSSQLKNRITMMTKTKSSKTASLKYLAGLPLLALLFLAFSSFDDQPNAPLSSTEDGQRILRDTHPDGDVYKEVDEMPQFPGCEEVTGAAEQKACWQKKMFSFVFENLKYPEEAKKNGVDGLVVVKFIIEADGSITDAEIKRSIGSGCDEEVLKMVYMMPKWKPGKKDGKPVRVSFNLPVKFKLDPAGEKQKIDADEMPLFVEGCEGLKGNEQAICSKKQLVNFIVENLRYPEETKKANLEGTVVASFLIAENGEVTQPQIVKSLDKYSDAEVIRILEAMPKWSPARKDGKAVSVELKLPFKFALPRAEGEPGWKGKPRNLAKQVELFQVYPNPASDNISINFKTESGPVELRITDVNGKGLASMKLDHTGEEQLATFNTSDLSRGNIYVSLLGKKGKVLETTTVVLQ